jgi:hypothetical protein
MLSGKYRNLHSRTLTIGALLVLAFICSIPAFAQDITSGTIQGTVTDEKGAVVQGATVEAKNTATNFSRTFVTDEDGRFTLPFMPPGIYVVTVTKDGFSKLNNENVEVTVGKTVVLNPSLKVSGVTGEVTVTETATVDTVKTEF